MNILFLCFFLCFGLCEARVKLRLAGGKHKYEGRVEVLVRGKWGLISDRSWDKNAAQVVCRQLGFNGEVIRYTKGTVYGHPSRNTDVFLREIKCKGSESHIDDCKHSGWLRPRLRLSFYRLAGVMCFTPDGRALNVPIATAWKDIKSSSKIEVSLDGQIENGTISSGYLMVSYKNQNGHVCADNWSTTLGNMRVACGQLGFPEALEMRAIQGKKAYILNGLSCRGLESSVVSCNHTGFAGKQKKCQSNKAVWLKCKVFTRADRYKNSTHLRLRGSAYPWEGRIGLLYKGYWANLCDDTFNLLTANTICRSLGYGTAREASFAAKYGQGTQMIVIENITCGGYENDIKKCKWTVLPRSSCTHFEDSGVICNAPKYELNEMRLVGGNNSLEGRVEVKINGVWGTVCGDHWMVKSALIVCRGLGLNFAQANITGNEFGVGGKMVMSKPVCIGDEVSLVQCLHDDNVTCSSANHVAAVRCTDALPDLSLSVGDIHRTIRVDYLPNGMLRCSWEENCLDSSAAIYMRDEYIRMYRRRLMRFSSVILNFGSADYRPILKKKDWIWHSCHKHFHSEEEFATYDLLTADRSRKVAAGHKASFCLEDTNCLPGVDRKYNCTNGEQGISLNCFDDYAYNIDCQWIDVTTVPYDRDYVLQVFVNPKLQVPETDFDNNIVVCHIRDRGSFIRVTNCSYDYCSSGLRSHGGNANKACCVFPFQFRGSWFNTCTNVGLGQFWCSTTTIYEGNYKWGLC